MTDAVPDAAVDSDVEQEECAAAEGAARPAVRRTSLQVQTELLHKAQSDLELRKAQSQMARVAARSRKNLKRFFHRPNVSSTKKRVEEDRS